VGIVCLDDDGEFPILSNPRVTYITPPGTGFLPRETAWHHQAVKAPCAILVEPWTNMRTLARSFDCTLCA
jgi:hypothetical protein